MAQKPRVIENVVPLFGEDTYEIEDGAWGRSILSAPVEAPSVGHLIDLNGKPKIVFAIGAGHSGKTTFLRYCAEQGLARDSGTTTKLTAIDPSNRDMKNFFANVYEPTHRDAGNVATFLKSFVDALVRDQSSGLVDTGAGDMAVGKLIEEIPTLIPDLAAVGVEIVLAYMFSPRLSDLSELATLEAAGFQPAATALILNEGRVEGGVTTEQAFANLRRQSVYRSALERGAVELRMPRLSVAKKIEDRRVSFLQSAQGKIPEGRKVAPLGFSDQIVLRSWLRAMELALSPIVRAGWIP